MTQSQIDRLRECKKKAVEIKNELLDIWSETNKNTLSQSDEELRDIKIFNSIGVAATDLVIAFNRHDKII